MVPFAEALKVVLARTPILPTCRVPIQQAGGCYLAESVAAPFDVPRFDSSAMDGYAVRLSDVETASPNLPAKLKLLGVVRAGEISHEAISSDTALKVLTGAPLPKSAEAVVMKEHAEEQNGYVLIRRSVARDENIRRAKQEYWSGQTALKAGTYITPPVVGLLASFGMASVMVRERPRVALIVTGDELTLPGAPLHDGQIYDANSYSLSSALRLLPVELTYVAHSGDDLAALQRDLSLAFARVDVIITVGGASVGDFDFVKEALARLGVHLHFSTVAMKPGKPTIFGTLEDQTRERLIFGLPGNPVSALVCFHLLVRPALLKMLGAAEVLSSRVTAMLGSTLRKETGRLEFVRGRLVHEQGRSMVYPTLGQESHMLGGIAAANALIHFPAEAVELNEGESVVVEMLAW